jgi:hypothetical protein
LNTDFIRGIKGGFEFLDISIGPVPHGPRGGGQFELLAIERPGIDLHFPTSLTAESGAEGRLAWPRMNRFDAAEDDLIETEVEAQLIEEFEQEEIRPQ